MATTTLQPTTTTPTLRARGQLGTAGHGTHQPWVAAHWRRLRLPRPLQQLRQMMLHNMACHGPALQEAARAGAGWGAGRSPYRRACCSGLVRTGAMAQWRSGQWRSGTVACDTVVQ